jgi:hypothetical protein
LALTGVSITPHLLLIFFGCEDENHLDYMAYLKMLKSRCTAENCALKSAALLIADGPEPESATISGLHALFEEGLDLLLLEGMEVTDEIALLGLQNIMELNFAVTAVFMVCSPSSFSFSLN